MFAHIETWLLLGVQALLTVAGAAMAYAAIRNARTPQGAAGWVVFLVAFPLLALPAYAIFGRLGFGGYIKRRQALQSALRRSGADMGAAGWDRLATLDAISPLAVTVGNDVELFAEGAPYFDAVLAAIDAAEIEVVVQFYIVRDDALGRRLHQRLVAAARRGVRVRLACDALGSLWLGRRYLRELREAGVETVVMRGPKRPLGRFGLNFRNHRKTVVIDGRTGFTGGHNLGQEYIDGGRRFESWRDTSIRVEGPVAWQLRRIFEEDWTWAAGVPLDAPEGLSEPPEDGPGVPALLIPSGPTDELERASLALMALIGAARTRLWLASPYLVPHTDILSALQLAARRGVEVRILIPKRPDKWLPWLAARAFFEDLSLAGVEIWEYGPGFMHQKVVLVDDDLTAVGTLNLDVRSAMLNFESTVAVQDEAFAARVEAMLEADFAVSQRVDGDLSSAPFAVRSLAPVARLFSPVL